MRQSVRDSSSPRNDCVPRTSSPRTTLERTICRLWQEVLGLDAIGVHDPFLLVGGDSLRAAQIASRLSAVLDAEVLLWELLEASTIAGLASLITQKQLEADAACRNEG